MSRGDRSGCVRGRHGAGEGAWVCAIGAALIGGCVAADPERTAPRVTAAVVDAALARGFAAEDLGRGRTIYVERCGECHTLQSPAERGEEEWREIMPRMVRLTRLGADDARRVNAYVFSMVHAGAAGVGER